MIRFRFYDVTITFYTSNQTVTNRFRFQPCEKLQSERVALLSEINAIWQNEFQNNENFTDLSEVDQLQLLMDNIRSR